MAFSAKTEINSAPIILRLRSGSVTPLSCVRKRPEASTPMTRRPRRSRSISSVCSNSFLRSRPVLTKTFVRRSPMARCTSTAATVESTPPLSAQMTRLFDGSDGVLRAAHGSKAGRQPDDVVAVTVPDAQRVGKLREELGFVSGTIDIQHRAAVFTARRRLHFPAQVVGEPLHTVADSQHRDAERKNGRVAFGSLRVVDGTGSAGEHNARGFELADFVERGGARENGREDLLLANAPGDELRVLAAEIENDYAAAFGVRAFVLVLLHLGSAGHCPPFFIDKRRP